MFSSSNSAVIILSLVLFHTKLIDAVGIKDIDSYSRDGGTSSCETNTTSHESGFHPKIKYGYPVNVKNYPSVVGLLFYNYFHCGGTILSTTSVITAGHCVKTSGEYQIRAGSSYRDYGGTVYDVININVHPKYDSYSQDFDFAILTPRPDIRFNRFTQRVPLVKTKVPDNAEVEAVGWGFKEDHNLSNELRGVKIYTINFQTCVSRLYWYTVTSRMICAEDKSTYRRKDTCMGDSGGPLYHRGSLAGITSWGDCNKNYPSVYSNVYRLRNWIYSNL